MATSILDNIDVRSKYYKTNLEKNPSLSKVAPWAQALSLIEDSGCAGGVRAGSCCFGGKTKPSAGAGELACCAGLCSIDWVYAVVNRWLVA